MASLLAYCLEVVKTNRILESPDVARSTAERVVLFSDLDALARSGYTNLFRGFSPYFLAMLVRNTPLAGIAATSHWRTNPVTSAGLLPVTLVGTFLANPLEIMAIRYQHTQFTRSNLPTDLKAAFGGPRNLFTLGMWHAFARNLILATFFLQSRDNMDPWVGGMIAAILSHPFDVLRTRQAWAVLEQGSSDISCNPFQAIKESVKAQGLGGLMRGVVPRTLLLTFSYHLWARTAKETRLSYPMDVAPII